MANGLRLTVVEDVFPVAGTFTISRGSRTEIRVVTVTLSDDIHVGRGECVPYARYGETVDGVMEAIRGTANDLRDGLDRRGLQALLAPGAARNALDCAFWDLEAKRAGKPVWQLAGLSAPQPIETAFTLSLGTPESMREAAAKNAERPLLKVKLGTDDDLGRIAAVRTGDSGIPASSSMPMKAGRSSKYLALAPALVRLGVALVEQPLPAGQDEAFEGRSTAFCRSAPTRAATTARRYRISRATYDAVQHRSSTRPAG